MVHVCAWRVEEEDDPTCRERLATQIPRETVRGSVGRREDDGVRAHACVSEIIYECKMSEFEGMVEDQK